MLKLDKNIHEFRISTSNHLLIRNNDLLYKSKQKIKDLINELEIKNLDEMKLKLEDDFDDQEFKSISVKNIRGHFVVGFDRNEKNYKVYNYDLE